MPVVLRSDEAIDDLVDIWCWVSRDNVDAADRLIRDFDQLFLRLGVQPFMGERCVVRRRTLRRFPHGNYVVYYRIRRDAVEIVRVLHGARNPGPLL